jgi:hypothetical protein
VVELDKKIELQFVCCNKGYLPYEVTRVLGTKYLYLHLHTINIKILKNFEKYFKIF